MKGFRIKYNGEEVSAAVSSDNSLTFVDISCKDEKCRIIVHGTDYGNKNQIIWTNFESTEIGQIIECYYDEIETITEPALRKNYEERKISKQERYRQLYHYLKKHGVL